MPEKKNILVIEDNAEMRENICELLMLEGYAVCSTASGTAALNSFKTQLPDLILCDIVMPELSGFDILHIIKTLYPGNQISFIFLTGSIDKNYKCKSLDLGADDFILKPFSEAELLSSIKNRLKKAAALKRSLEEKKLSYMQELEEVSFLLSHSVRSHLCSSLGLTQLLDENNRVTYSTDELKMILDQIRFTALKMDDSTEHMAGRINAFLSKHKNN